MAFAGYLLKVGTGANAVEIPMKYMRASTFKATPDQRMEWSAERNVAGFLKRETVPNTPPKIEFNTPSMTNVQVAALNALFIGAFSDASQRKLTVEYFDQWSNSYKTHECYMPDVQFPIRNVDVANNIINYDEIRYAFIGY